jgi:GWxTD domain-containing protein
MRLEVYWALGWKASGWATPISERRIDPAVAAAEAIGLLDQALVVDPDNRLASWWLGTHFLMTEQWSEVVPVMSHMIREGVHLPEALLGRGLALQHLGHLDMAWRDYLQGLGMLPEEVRLLAADPSWVLPPSQGGQTLAGSIGGGAAPTGERPGLGGGRAEAPPAGEMSGATVAEETGDDPFWRAKDPLFATQLNERLIEQVRRFAFATWRFAVPNLGLRGWDTHRGRIYLRYGEPLVMATQSDALRQRINPVAGDQTAAGDITDPDEGTAAAVMAAAAEAKLYNVKETWHYEDMTFTFGGGMTSGNMVLWPSDFFGDINSMADFEKLAERLPESSRVEGDRKVRDIAATWYRFEGSDGSVELIPVAQFAPVETRSAGASMMLGEKPVHLIVLDGSWRSIAREESALPRGFRVPPRGASWVGPLVRVPIDDIRTAAAAGQPGPMYAALEVVPSGEEPAYAARDTLSEVGADPLRLSSLVVATNIQEESRAGLWREGTFFTRQGQAIVPRPDGQYELNEPLIVYAEIYGLAKDAIGATDYQIALTITALERRRGLAPVVTSTLGRLTGRQEREGSVTLLFDRADIFSRAHEQIRIVFPTGEFSNAYEVRFEVRDRLSGASASRTTRVAKRGSSSGG